MRYLAHNTRVFPGSDKAFRNAVACIVDRDFIINSVLQGTVERMDGTISGALTAWAAPVTGVLADCDGLDTEENGINLLEYYKMLDGQLMTGENTQVMIQELSHQQELKVQMVKFHHQIC